MKEKYINHCKSRLFKKNIFPANVGHLSIQIKIRVKKCHFCWRYLRFSIIFMGSDLLHSIMGTLTPNGSFSMSMIQKVGTSFNHVGGFQ